MAHLLKHRRVACNPLSHSRAVRSSSQLIVKAFKFDTLAAPVRLPVHLNDLASLNVLSPRASTRPDVWTRARYGLTPNSRQTFQEHVDTLRDWISSYSSQVVGLLEAAVDEQRQEAFLFISSHAYNTGTLFGRTPTCRPSDMAGLYRIKYDADGQASDIWQFRTGSHEERDALLGPNANVTTMPWLHDLHLTPCTWPTGADSAARMRATLQLWAQDICTKNRLERLSEVVSDDVEYYDCLDMQRHVDASGVDSCRMRGSAALAGRLRGIKDKFEQCAMQLRSVVVEEGGNKVFVHWSQGLTCRLSGRASVVEGASLFVFDAQARIVQLLDFYCPPIVESNLMAAGAVLMAGRAAAAAAAAAAGGPVDCRMHNVYA